MIKKNCSQLSIFIIIMSGATFCVNRILNFKSKLLQVYNQSVYIYYFVNSGEHCEHEGARSAAALADGGDTATLRHGGGQRAVCGGGELRRKGRRGVAIEGSMYAGRGH